MNLLVALYDETLVIQRRVNLDGMFRNLRGCMANRFVNTHTYLVILALTSVKLMDRTSCQPFNVEVNKLG